MYNYRGLRDAMVDTWDCKHLSHSINVWTSIWEQFAFSAVRSSTQTHKSIYKVGTVCEISAAITHELLGSISCPTTFFVRTTRLQYLRIILSCLALKYKVSLKQQDEMLSLITTKSNQGINCGFLYLSPPISINYSFVVYNYLKVGSLYKAL